MPEIQCTHINYYDNLSVLFGTAASPFYFFSQASFLSSSDVRNDLHPGKKEKTTGNTSAVFCGREESAGKVDVPPDESEAGGGQRISGIHWSSKCPTLF